MGFWMKRLLFPFKTCVLQRFACSTGCSTIHWTGLLLKFSQHLFSQQKFFPTEKNLRRGSRAQAYFLIAKIFAYK